MEREEHMRKKSKLKRARRKLRNIILKVTAYFMGIAWFVSACALDYDSWIPGVVFAVSFTWIWLFAYANGWMGYEE